MNYRIAIGLALLSATGMARGQTTAEADHDGQQKQIRIVAHPHMSFNGGGMVGGMSAPIPGVPGMMMTINTSRKEKAAFLGVTTSGVSPSMRQQLQLKKGVGLLVETVEQDSPAESSGLKQYDILQKLDDQWLVNTQQLSVLVRMHNPGEEVTLSVIREAKPLTIKAKLVEKEMFATDDAAPMGMLNGTFNVSSPNGTVVMESPMNQDVMTEIRKSIESNQSATMSMSDDENTLTLSNRDGKKHLTALDRDGKVLFNGPVDTDEQRKALPAPIAEKLAKLESKPNMIRIEKFNHASTAPAADHD